MNTITTTNAAANTTTAAALRADIMRRAHALTRDTITAATVAASALASVPSYSATFAAALRLAWAEATDGATVARAAARNAAALRAAWNKLTAAAQLEWVKKCVYRAAILTIGRSTGGTDTAPAYGQYWETIAFCGGGQDFEDMTQQAFADVLEALATLEETARARAERGDAPWTLARLVYRTSANAVERVRRAQCKHASALRTFTAEDGGTAFYVEEVARARDGRTEEEALLNVTVEAFLQSQDDVNRRIWAARAAGALKKDIAPAVGMSPAAVGQRLSKMHAAYKAFCG